MQQNCLLHYSVMFEHSSKVLPNTVILDRKEVPLKKVPLERFYFARLL